MRRGQCAGRGQCAVSDTRKWTMRRGQCAVSDTCE